MRDVIFMNPVYKDYIWGGTKLIEKFKKKTKFDKVAESWEISANQNGKSIIKNGEFKGKTLDELFNNEELKREIFGTKAKELSEFPVLIKFIDANDNLSVQVHPNDEYAKKFENSQGKSEIWYIIDCKEGAKLVCGLKKEGKEVKEIIKSNKIEEHLNFVNVKKGDYIFIEAGTVHAILGGNLICEIQQNSAITYRIYDWNRVGKDGKPRELHINKALDVININSKSEVKHCDENIQVENITANDKFSTDVINVKTDYEDETDGKSFYAYNVVEGNGILIVKNKKYKLVLGDSFIIPANLGAYTINGKMQLLKTYI